VEKKRKSERNQGTKTKNTQKENQNLKGYFECLPLSGQLLFTRRSIL
jgi:hypothetical protein